MLMDNCLFFYFDTTIGTGMTSYIEKICVNFLFLLLFFFFFSDFHLFFRLNNLLNTSDFITIKLLKGFLQQICSCYLFTL